MKVTITALKAPWPSGAKVGDVVYLGGAPLLPAWAIGKCDPAGDGAEAAFTWAPPAPPAEPEPARDLAADLALATSRVSELEASLADARDYIESGEQAAHADRQKLRELEAENAGLRAQLAARETDEGKAAASLAEAEQQAAAEKVAALERKGAGKKA